MHSLLIEWNLSLRTTSRQFWQFFLFALITFFNQFPFFAFFSTSGLSGCGLLAPKPRSGKLREAEAALTHRSIRAQLTTAPVASSGGPHGQSCARLQHLGESLELVQKVRSVIRARNALAGMLTGQSWEERHDKKQCETRLKSLDLWLLKLYRGIETSENK